MDRPTKSDAAPTATGASVKQSNVSRDSTLVHLPMTPPSHHNAPAGTSTIAAHRIAGHAAKQRSEVFGVILREGARGATDAEIEAVTGIRAQSVSPRRGELRTLGLIVDSGKRRPTPSGRPAAVWITSNYATESHGGAA